MLHCFHAHGGQVHTFTMGGRYFALDVESGSLHALSPAAYAVLGGNTTGLPPHIIEETLQDVRELAQAGQLFAPPGPSAAQLTAHMQARTPVVKALCLHMAHACNLRCAYCFAGRGDYGTDLGLMPLEVGRQALDFLIAQSGARRNLEVDFFGGEPLLNWPVVQALVAYGREREAQTGKRFRFTLTTNGALLEPHMHDYINTHFDNVVLSLDGRPPVNDRMRRLAATGATGTGSGSYATVLPRIQALAEARGHRNYYVRGTFTRHNLDFAADVLHLAQAGFSQLSVEPVVAPPHTDYALRESDLPTLFEEYENLAQSLLNREDVRFFHFEMNVYGGPCLAKRVTGCGAGSEYLAVTPSGRLFPCHQFVGDDRFCLGHVSTGITQNTDVLRDFAQCHVLNKPECATCWARYHCSGGCMATAFHTHGSIMQPDAISCALMKKRIECALYVSAERTHSYGRP